MFMRFGKTVLVVYVVCLAAAVMGQIQLNRFGAIVILTASSFKLASGENDG